MPLTAAPTSTSAETRPGSASAASIAILPPIELPTSAARSMPSASSSPTRSSCIRYGTVGAAERPYPRTSYTTAR